MGRPCKFAIAAFLLLYTVALAILVVGTYGLFGAERDPLSGIFLVPLGLPWNRLLSDLPDALLPWVGVAAPVFNLLLLWLLCRAAARRRAATGRTS